MTAATSKNYILRYVDKKKKNKKKKNNNKKFFIQVWRKFQIGEKVYFFHTLFSELERVEGNLFLLCHKLFTSS
jgi:hypothetical protein